MPRLVDDPTYRTALARFLVAQRELYVEYQRELAAASGDRLARALVAMNGTWNEAAVRSAFADWPDVAGKIGLEYIRKALVASGQIELGKRFYEIGAQVADDELPADMLEALAELRASGELGVFETPVPHPDTLD